MSKTGWRIIKFCYKGHINFGGPQIGHVCYIPLIGQDNKLQRGKRILMQKKVVFTKICFFVVEKQDCPRLMLQAIFPRNYDLKKTRPDILV
jgi:hypothetical protein